ncbi:Uu.00g084680.m01.CDS01 [Anthostomella pinea]|uniref:Uu.00g084680.m01.CDS01 n=1 Tax=Anthostomella pinea TaxID=933095 RepID=A0AAI8VMF6_9PEZI|nr:Uu.00g084680.m01.CDS01 [Anthostomella pinea]
MGSTSILSDKDVNRSAVTYNAADNAMKPDVKSMDYHRQVLQSKMDEEKYGAAAPAIPVIPTATTWYTTAAIPAIASHCSQHPVHTLADLDDRRKQQYISPSDNIMSPCSAKLNALKGRQAGKAKPKSLFAQASAKKFVDGENVLGAKNAVASSPTKPDSN